MTWSGYDEPPLHVLHVRDEHDGLIADRLSDVPCGHCGPPRTWWRWRHNGNAECWLDIDGVGPFLELEG